MAGPLVPHVGFEVSELSLGDEPSMYTGRMTSPSTEAREAEVTRSSAQLQAVKNEASAEQFGSIWIFSRATPRGVEVHAPETPVSSRRGRSHGPCDAPRGPLDAKHLTVGTPRPSQSRRSSRRKRRCNPRSARTTSCDARLNA